MKKPEQVPAESNPFQIEQAIFTSATSAKSEGYHLVAVSPGISEPDRRELSIWGPSHDSLQETGHGALSVNFHPLPSGAFCVSQTTLEGAEYSGRGPQVYTHSLVVPPAVLEQFGNNPFVLLREATLAGHVRIYSEPPERLKGFTQPGGFPAVDEDLLAQLTEQFGAAKLTSLVDAVLDARCLGVVAGDSGPRLIAGVMNCLPAEVRTAFSLSTGLKHSPRRPFRLICAPSNDKECRRLVRQYEVCLFEVDEVNGQTELEHPWSRYLLTRLRTGDFARLGRELGRPRPRLTVETLSQLAAQLLNAPEESYAQEATPVAVAEDPFSGDAFDATAESGEQGAADAWGQPGEAGLDPFADLEQATTVATDLDADLELVTELDAAEFVGEDVEARPDAAPANQETVGLAPDAAWQEDSSSDVVLDAQGWQTNDGAISGGDDSLTEANLQSETQAQGEDMSHATKSHNFHDDLANSSGDFHAAGNGRKEPKPAFRLSRQCPEAAARLMRLEATIFEAMTGDDSAQQQLGPLWAEVQERLGQQLQTQCREEFLHYAIHMWQQFSTDGDRNPLQAAAALDVVCRLFEEQEQPSFQEANS